MAHEVSDPAAAIAELRAFCRPLLGDVNSANDRGFEAIIRKLECAQPLLGQIEAEARRYAGMYPDASDGRNTFVVFADWVARLTCDAAHS